MNIFTVFAVSEVCLKSGLRGALVHKRCLQSPSDRAATSQQPKLSNTDKHYFQTMCNS